MTVLRAALPSILITAFAAASLFGQQLPPTRPSVNGVFPHGAQAGTDVDVSIRGNRLQRATGIEFLTPKLRADILEVSHNLVKARIHVDPSVELGRHDFHVVSPNGSTVAWFDVNRWPETLDKEPNNDPAAAQPIEFPFLLNGTVAQRDYDYFKFTAKAGQTVAFDLAAGRNESNFDGVLSLVDADGVELAYVDDYYWFKDPHLAYTIKKDGTYYIRVFGAGESGGRNSDYRLTGGHMAHVYHAMPLGGQRGTTVDVELHGVKLSNIERAVLGDQLATGNAVSRGDRSTTIRLAIPKDTPEGVYRLHVDGATYPVPFVVSSLPEITVTTASAGNKQKPVAVTLPVVANGVLDTPNAGHFFTIEVSEPHALVLAVDSFRFEYHLDPIVILYDDEGKRIAYQDDPTTNSAKEPANVDPHLVFHLPKAGHYTVQVRDNAFRGDPNFPYRLTLKRAEPTFQAGIVGTDDTMFRGRTHIVTVQVRRLEGWDSPVEVRVENLPPGVTGPESVIVPIEPTRFRGTCAEEHILDGTKMEYPLQIAADAPPGLYHLSFRARGEMNGRVVEQVLVPRYWFSPLKRIMGFSPGSDMFATIGDLPPLVLDIPERTTVLPSSEGSVQVVVTRLDGGSGPLELRAANLPDGVTISPVMVRPGATLADLKIAATGKGPFSAIIEGVCDGKVLGRTHPLEIEVRATRSRNEERSDDN